MAKTITIEIDDDGAATVTVDDQTPQDFDTAADALEYVDDAVNGEMPNEEYQAEEGAEPEGMEEDEEATTPARAKAMWDQEASKRKSLYEKE